MPVGWSVGWSVDWVGWFVVAVYVEPTLFSLQIVPGGWLATDSRRVRAQKSWLAGARRVVTAARRPPCIGLQFLWWGQPR
jgi:hypothetical protein